MTQLYNLADLAENDINLIRNLKEVVSENPGKYTRYFKIEENLIKKGKAVNLESYLLQEYHFHLRNIQDISEELEVSYNSIYNLMKEMLIPIRTIKESKSILGISEKSRQKMADAKKGNKNPMYGLKGENHPGYGRKRTSGERRRISQTQLEKRGIIKPSRGRLYDLYWNKEKFVYEIGNDYGVRWQTVTRWLKEYGINLRNRKEITKIARKINIPKEEIKETCERDDLTFVEKAEKLKIHPMTLHRKLKEFGIKNIKKKTKRKSGSD